jgi:hypothetical protein
MCQFPVATLDDSTYIARKRWPLSWQCWLGLVGARSDLRGLADFLANSAAPVEESVEIWPDLSRHLITLQSRFLFFTIWSGYDLAGQPDSWKPRSLNGLTDEKTVIELEGWLRNIRHDEMALTEIRGWHEAPSVAPLLRYHDVPLGDGLEYDGIQWLLGEHYCAFDGARK